MLSCSQILSKSHVFTQLLLESSSGYKHKPNQWASTDFLSIIGKAVTTAYIPIEDPIWMHNPLITVHGRGRELFYLVLYALAI